MPDDKWRTVSCGCCAGLEWVGDYPRECRRCGGGGTLFIRPKGHLFQYPGGPAAGIGMPEEYAQATPCVWTTEGGETDG